MNRPPLTATSDPLSDFNTDAWTQGDYVGDYVHTEITPPEAILLARHVSATDLVLELGCGAGRLTRVLVGLAAEVRATDVSELMVHACRRSVPAAHVKQADLRDMRRTDDASVDVMVAANNLLDILGDAERRRTLQEIRRVLKPSGVLLFSSHNRAFVVSESPRRRLQTRLDALRTPRGLARAIWHVRLIPQSRRNRLAARVHERDEPGYAIVNDSAHAYRLALYYIGRDAQERQLGDEGFAMVACLDANGVQVPAGEQARSSSCLHYAARPVA